MPKANGLTLSPIDPNLMQSICNPRAMHSFFRKFEAVITVLLSGKGQSIVGIPVLIEQFGTSLAYVKN